MANFNFNHMMQGILGNMSEQSAEELATEFSPYLFDNETIQMGYKLIRDVILFTDIRIIFVDKQGATGKKTSFKSIFLSHIIDVEMETAGRSFDDSEITITYLKNVNRQSRHEEHIHTTFEFPKSTDILPLYRFLGNLVVQNREEING